MIWFTGKSRASHTYVDFTLKDITEEGHLNKDGDNLYISSDLGVVAIDPATIKMGRTPTDPGWDRTGRGRVRRVKA